MTERLTRELEDFGSSGLWAGGYFEADPLDPMAPPGGYGQLGYMSVLHATWLACIKPYVGPDTVALEIGPGRGAWTKTLLPAREVWAVDALPEEHNRFYDYLGHPEHVRYVQVRDFTLSDLPDDRFTYSFSFGALCHVSFDGIAAYAASAFGKLRSGAHCFWMVGDYAKFNAAVAAVDRLSPWHRMVRRPRYAPARALLALLGRPDHPPHPVPPDTDEEPVAGRWYDAGTDRTCTMLEQVGYRVVDPDTGVNHRDPVIHFVRP
jgi:hypothetical protein